LHNEEFYCSVLLNKYYAGDQIKEDEIGEACGTYKKKGQCIKNVGGRPEGRKVP